MEPHVPPFRSGRDIPLRVFSESYYPNLTKLYRALGVKYQAADYSFSCRAGYHLHAYFRYVNIFLKGMALPVPMCLGAQGMISCLRLAYQARVIAQPNTEDQRRPHVACLNACRWFRSLLTSLSTRLATWTRTQHAPT